MWTPPPSEGEDKGGGDFLRKGYGCEALVDRLQRGRQEPSLSLTLSD